MNRVKRLLFLLLFAFPLPALERADSLLEVGLYRLDVLGRPDSAAAAFRQAAAEAGENAETAERARRGLRRALLAGSRDTGSVAGFDALPDPSGRPLLRWRRTFGDWHLRHALVCGGTLLILSHDGYLSGLDTAAGRPIWSRGGFNADVEPATDGSLLALAGNDGAVMVLNPSDGRPLWGLSGRAAPTALTASRGLLFAVHERGAAALNLRSGQLIWDKGADSERDFSGQAAAGYGIALFQLADGSFQCHDAESGRLLWRSGPGLSDPLLTQDWVYFVKGRELLAAGRLTGKTGWNRAGQAGIEGLSPLPGNRIAVLSGNGELLTLDARNGEALSTALVRPGRMTAVGDRLLLLDGKGNVICGRPDGRVLWRFATGESEGMGIIRAGAKAAVWTENNGLFLLDPDSPHARDQRVTVSLSRARSLLKSGLTRMAGSEIRATLAAVEPGHPELNLLNARILTQTGSPALALAAWERCLHSADPAFLLEENITEPLRRLSGARWTAYLPSAARFTPMLLYTDRLIIPGTGELSLLSLRDGRLMWRYRLSNPVEPILNGCVAGRLFVGQAEGSLLALDLESQSEEWRIPFRKSVTALAAGPQGLLAAGTWSEGVFFIETAEGRVVKSVLERENALFPWTAGNLLWITGLKGSLTAFEGLDTRVALSLGSPLLAGFAEGGERVFVPTGDGRLCAVSASQGRLLWRVSTGVQISALTADPTRVYSVLSGPSAWAAHDPATGRRFWLRRNGAFQPELAAAGNGFLALAGDNKIILCDPETGDTRRQWIVAGRIASLVTDKKGLFARLENGLVYAFDPGP